MKYKLGVDVGGTFTDFILISQSGESTILKTLSTPSDPSIGVINGIYDLAGITGNSPKEFLQSIETIVHGTTVATNALLTLKGAKTALITTKGFRDALQMRRGIREEQYNNHYRNVTPLVPRYLRLTIDERIDSAGNILRNVQEAELESIVEILEEEEVEAVAVCFINSYKNSVNEEHTAEFLKDKLPGVFITSSVEVLPSIRFYERVSTTVVNAYIGPVVSNYLNRLTEKLKEIEFSGALLIMQSNGGVVTPDVVKKSPAVTVLSGPAAAPTAAAFYANLMNHKDCITIDMGGTSFDASLVINNQSVTSTEGEINRYRIALPSLDIATIGAGGGSIGWIDEGELLQMGPQSAGAIPGPVCYDTGGKEPTCTDANLILGYLNPHFFAGGKIILNKAKAEKQIKERLSARLNLSLLDTAKGMYRIINHNMAQGVREVTVERGHDPREFLFIVAGGAGPVHACEICRELEIPMFIVPNTASIFCAAGMLLGDLKHDYIKSYVTPLSTVKVDYFLEIFQQMRQKGISTLRNEGVTEENIEFYPSLDLRYIGQFHEVQLATSWETIMAFDKADIYRAFHKEHNRLYGYSLEEEGTELELINVRLRVLGKTEKPDFLAGLRKPVSLQEALKGKRPVYIPETDTVEETPIYDGDLPLYGEKIDGPAVIERVNTSIFISADYDCQVDKWGNFVIYNREKHTLNKPVFIE